MGSNAPSPDAPPVVAPAATPVSPQAASIPLSALQQTPQSILAGELGSPTGITTPSITDIYNTLQSNFYQPLNLSVNPTAPAIDDPTMQALANQMLAIQKGNAVGNGTQAPSAASVLAKASSHLSAGEIASQVGKGTWQQMVMDPFQQFMHTWQTDPKAGLMETLGGAAMIGGVIGLEAITGGAATPFIFAAGAALVAPGMIKSWLDEVQNPTDANLVKALIGTSTGILTVGLPTKWSAGMGVQRAGLMARLNDMRAAIEPRGVTKMWQTGATKIGEDLVQGSYQNLRADIPLGKQLDTLATTWKAMKKQFERWNVPVDDMAESGQLLQVQEKLDAIGQAITQAKKAGDHETASALEAEAIKTAGEEYRTLRLSVARHYRFLASRPFSHVPIWGGQVKASEIGPQLMKELQGHVDTSMGQLDALVGGIGMTNERVLPSIATVIEHQSASLSGGAPEAIINKLALSHLRITDILGVDDKRPIFEAGKVPEDAWARLSPMEQVEVGLEDPKRWKMLTPKQQLYGQYRAAMENGLSVAGLKHGVIPLSDKGGVRAIRTGAVPAEDATQLIRNPLRPMEGKIPAFSRTYQLAFDEAKGWEFDAKRSRMSEFEKEFQMADKYDPHFVEYWNQHGQRITAARKSIAGHKSQITTKTKRLAEAQGKVEIRKAQSSLEDQKAKLADVRAGVVQSFVDQGLTEAEAKKAAEYVHMEKVKDPVTGQEFDPLAEAKDALPPGRKLLSGKDLFHATAAAAVYRLHAMYYNTLYASHADAGMKAVEDAVLRGGHSEQMLSLLTKQEFRDKIGGAPDFLRAKAFRGGGPEGVDTHADWAGYAQVSPQIGNVGDLHYQDAIYARKEIAQKIQLAYDNSYNSSQLHQGIVGALYTGVSKTKHVIMMSPAWHFMNVAGRALAFVLNDPATAMPALKTMFGHGDILLDERLRSQLSAEFQLAGGKAANKFNVSRALHLNDREQNGQSHWPSVIRTPVGTMWHAYEKHVEDGFWKMVDDFQLAAYTYSKNHLQVRNPEMGETEAKQLSALYANDLGGMVNPLYMNKAYKEMRNLIWFAPSYWATFTRSLLSVAPGADRLSSFLSKYHEGALTRFGAVPLKAVSDIGRREMVRMHRSWTMTYLATAFVSADFLNMMLGGRHLWENDQGHMFDINVDKAASLFGQGPQQKGTATKHAYFSGMPMFRQAMDVANALGLGHDYGFAHQFGDQNWQQLDAMHKAMMLGGGLLDGIKEQAASKTSAPAQAAWGLAMGETLSGRAKGVQREIGGPLGRFSALASFIPGGSAAESAMTQNQSLPDALKTYGGSLLQQYTGLPSIYHMGMEQLPVDDSVMKNWADQRAMIHQTLGNASKQMFNGEIQPIQYERLRQQSVDKMLQLDADTFGNSTPTGALSRTRLELEQANGLNRNDLTDSQWAERNDIFQMEWEQALQTASPEARAAWWEAETSQWTDADYLVWEAQQMRSALMGSIDGQGGAHIRAYQHQIGPLLDIPSTAMRKALEQGDPYYYTYRQVLKQMAATSSLGAFISAFVSPYANTLIEPQQLTPDQEAAMASVVDSSATLIRPATAEALAAEAKKRAHSAAVEQSGGKATADPGFSQEVGGMIQQAEGTVASNA